MADNSGDDKDKTGGLGGLKLAEEGASMGAPKSSSGTEAPSPAAKQPEPENKKPAPATEETKKPPVEAKKPGSENKKPVDKGAEKGAKTKAAPLNINIKDKAVLYATYMHFIKPNGGLFIPTKKVFEMDEELSLLVALPGETEKFPVVGKIAWITPAGSQGSKAGGIGLQFESTNEAETLQKKIETLLATVLKSERPTHTM